MAKRTIEDLNVKGKTVLVRVDFNVPHKNGTVTDDTRIRAALPTINYLTSHGAKVILFSHLGKIKTEEDKAKNDMSIVAEALAGLQSAPVKFVNATRGAELEDAVHGLKEGEILLMQNTRYEPGETKNDPELAKYWASLADLYVEDAFGSVHRAHASTVGVPALLPNAGGYLIAKELKYLGKALDDPARPFVAVLGGAKVSDKIGVIDNLLEKADKVIAGGAMAYTFIAAKGYGVGTSLVETDKIEDAKKFIAKGGDKLILPVDTVITDNLDNPTRIETVDCDKMPEGMMGVDIGPKTIALFTKALEGAHTVFWNGPMGVFEKEEFAAGTKGICAAVAALPDCMSVIGGGDSASAAKKFGYADKFTHISTGGGASLEYMEGKQLPGIAVLSDKA